MEPKPKYLIFDERASYDLDEALLLDTADTLKEARAAAKLQGGGCIFDNVEKITQNHFIESVQTG